MVLGEPARSCLCFVGAAGCRGARRRGRGVEGDSGGRGARGRRLQGSRRGLGRAARARDADLCSTEILSLRGARAGASSRVEPLFFCGRPAEGCSECVRTAERVAMGRGPIAGSTLSRGVDF